VDIVTLRTSGLGDSTYLVSHDGMGFLVDPQRDVDRFLTAAAERDIELRWVFETHLHNDYISGAPEVARRSGADLVLPAAAGVAYRHVPAFHGEDLVAGDVAVRPLHTPGHTPEHTSYVVMIAGEPVAVFSGGSLLVGAAGRTDLLGPERARQLARLQFGSVRRLAALPEAVELFPTHGLGSFCTASMAEHANTTIGKERRDNPVLGHANADAFADGQLLGLSPYPSYYAHMGPANLLGPPALRQRAIPEIEPEQVRTMPDEVRLVDIRPRRVFAEGNIPGSIGIELSDTLGAWVGWLLPFNAPLVLVADADTDVDRAAVLLAQIGFDDIRGVLRGVARWEREGGPVQRHRVVGLRDVAEAIATGAVAQVLDVRAPDEWAGGHLDGAIHRYLPDLLAGPPEGLDPARPVWVVCDVGTRASMAANLLRQAGFEPVVLAGGGVPDLLTLLARRAGAPLGSLRL
jgi:rhodanese-related sulfurtransferase/glyoxylase-like metal-dependent hydrolase (beta-lactamase superfamily II)